MRAGGRHFLAPPHALDDAVFHDDKARFGLLHINNTIVLMPIHVDARAKVAGTPVLPRRLQFITND